MRISLGFNFVCLYLFTFVSACIAAAPPPEKPPTLGGSEAAAAPSVVFSPTPKSVGRAIPFRGMIASVDERARTFTIAGKDRPRVLKITECTVITKGGQPATMKDVVVDEEVRGSYYKLADESLEARTVKLGPVTNSDKTARATRQDKSGDQATSEKEDDKSPSPSVSPYPFSRVTVRENVNR